MNLPPTLSAQNDARLRGRLLAHSCNSAVLGLVLVVLASCAGGAAVPSVGGNGFQPTAEQLSPLLPQRERQIMTAALAALEPQDRNGAVIVYYNNAFYVNQPQYAHGPFIYQPTGVKNEYARPDGRKVLLVPSSDQPGHNGFTYDGTGVADAVYSPGNYSWFKSNVYLDCLDTLEEGPQTAETYTGGNSRDDVGADLGLEFNPAQNSNIGAVSDIEPFANAGGAVCPEKETTCPEGDANAQVTCDQTVSMKFYPTVSYVPPGTLPGGVAIPADFLVLTVNGETTVGNSLTIMQQVQPFTGWGQRCNNTCQVKYVTSLATKNSQNFFGSAFGLQYPFGGSPSGNPIPTIQWSSISRAFQSGAPVQQWNDINSHFVYPNGVNPKCVFYTTQNAPPNDQTIGIDEACTGFRLN